MRDRLRDLSRLLRTRPDLLNELWGVDWWRACFVVGGVGVGVWALGVGEAVPAVVGLPFVGMGAGAVAGWLEGLGFRLVDPGGGGPRLLFDGLGRPVLDRFGGQVRVAPEAIVDQPGGVPSDQHPLLDSHGGSLEGVPEYRGAAPVGESVGVRPLSGGRHALDLYEDGVRQSGSLTLEQQGFDFIDGQLYEVGDDGVRRRVGDGKSLLDVLLDAADRRVQELPSRNPSLLERLLEELPASGSRGGHASNGCSCESGGARRTAPMVVVPPVSSGLGSRVAKARDRLLKRHGFETSPVGTGFLIHLAAEPDAMGVPPVVPDPGGEGPPIAPTVGAEGVWGSMRWQLTGKTVQGRKESYCYQITTGNSPAGAFTVTGTGKITTTNGRDYTLTASIKAESSRDFGSGAFRTTTSISIPAATITGTLSQTGSSIGLNAPSVTVKTCTPQECASHQAPLGTTNTQTHFTKTRTHYTITQTTGDHTQTTQLPR